MSGTLFALGAIALWATLASLGVALSHVPPFLLTGCALVVGALPACARSARSGACRRATLALGIYGLFGFHFLLFLALRHAPPVEANLVNYLWPLLIVVLAPVLLPGMTLGPVHVGGGAGRLRRRGASRSARHGGVGRRRARGLMLGRGIGVHLGQLFAARRGECRRSRPRRSACSALASGLLALVCHALARAGRIAFAARLAADRAAPASVRSVPPSTCGTRHQARRPRVVGILTYLTPLASTLLLASPDVRSRVDRGRGALIVGAAVIGMRAR